MRKIIKISKREISDTACPFVIAEAGVNYYDIAKAEDIAPIDAAKLMVKAASDAGADAIKFQTYKAEKLASKYSPAYWDVAKENTRSQYELFKKYDKFREDEYVELADKIVLSAKAISGEVVILAEPNAGKPELIDGKAVYKVLPDDFAAAVGKIHSAGVNIIGGCCGTGPAHIEAAAKQLR